MTHGIDGCQLVPFWLMRRAWNEITQSIQRRGPTSVPTREITQEKRVNLFLLVLVTNLSARLPAELTRGDQESVIDVWYARRSQKS